MSILLFSALTNKIVNGQKKNTGTNRIGEMSAGIDILTTLSDRNEIEEDN